MRPQLFVGGLLVAAMGGGFYLLQIPLVYFWSVPFVIGGGVMMIASFFLSESPGPLRPPEGFRFCPFCSTPVQIGAQRCPHCNGLQPKEA
jgi:hypothetical protein